MLNLLLRCRLNWLILAAILGVAIPAARAAEGEVPGSEPDRVVAMSIAEQQAWLEKTIEQRIEPAARRVLPAADFDRLQLMHDDLRLGLEQGEPLTATVANDLLEYAELVEDSAVKRLSRQYRMQVYDAFRTDRRQYEQRIARWQQVQKRWEDAGAQPDERHKLVGCLATATAAVRRDGSQPLPETPRFGVAAEIAQPREPEPREVVVRKPVIVPEPPAMEREPLTGPRLGSAGGEPPLVLPAPVPKKPAAEPTTKPVVPTPPIRRAPPKIAPPEALPPREPKPPVPAPAVEPTPAVEPAPNPLPQARINVPQLMARSQGYLLELRRIEGDLAAHDRLPARELALLVADLVDLEADRETLDLYRPLVPEADRAKLGLLDFPAGTVGRLASKIATAREDAALQLKAGADRQTDLELLESLEKQLKELSAGGQ